MPSPRRHVGRDAAQGAGESADRLPERRLGPSVWGRVIGEQIDNHYRAFADPRASGQLLGFQSDIDLGEANGRRVIATPGASTVGYANANVDVSGLVTNEAATGYVLRHTGGLDLDAWSGGGLLDALRPG